MSACLRFAVIMTESHLSMVVPRPLGFIIQDLVELVSLSVLLCPHASSGGGGVTICRVSLGGGAVAVVAFRMRCRGTCSDIGSGSVAVTISAGITSSEASDQSDMPELTETCDAESSSPGSSSGLPRGRRFREMRPGRSSNSSGAPRKEESVSDWTADRAKKMCCGGIDEEVDDERGEAAVTVIPVGQDYQSQQHPSQ